MSFKRNYPLLNPQSPNFLSVCIGLLLCNPRVSAHSTEPTSLCPSRCGAILKNPERYVPVIIIKEHQWGIISLLGLKMHTDKWECWDKSYGNQFRDWGWTLFKMKGKFLTPCFSNAVQLPSIVNRIYRKLQVNESLQVLVWTFCPKGYRT